MAPNELELKKYELEERIKTGELNLKQKELDLKIEEQKSKRFLSPVLLSIVGGLITIITGIVLKYIESQSQITLEDKKFQSSLLLKAIESGNYDDFSDKLLAFQENGLLNLDSTKIRNLRKKRFIQEKINKKVSVIIGDSIGITDSIKSTLTSPVTPSLKNYTIVISADNTLKDARHEIEKASKNNDLKNVILWHRKKLYRTTIGTYDAYNEAVSDLFEVKERINKTAYIIEINKFCPNRVWDKRLHIYKCQ